jgi:2-dehydro-3-deoxygluconokinase
MRELLKYVDIAIASEEAVQLPLGITVDVDPSSGKLDQAQYEALAGKILSEFSNLNAIAISLRESQSPSHNGWSACLNDRNKNGESRIRNHTYCRSRWHRRQLRSRPHLRSWKPCDGH